MTLRLIAKPPRAASGDEGYGSYTADHIFVREYDTWTGLYDHEGYELHRPRPAFGFQPGR